MTPKKPQKSFSSTDAAIVRSSAAEYLTFVAATDGKTYFGGNKTSGWDFESAVPGWSRTISSQACASACVATVRRAEVSSARWSMTKGGRSGNLATSSSLPPIASM